MTTAKGNIRTTDTILHQVPAGGTMTITPRCGLGKAMVANLDKVVATYKRQLIVDQGPAKKLALQANAARRAARDAQSALDLDALLATI